MDLTRRFPRSGDKKLGGYPWLPRMIDKCRAYIDGTLGDYIFPCPIDMQLLTEIDVTEDEFEEIVRKAKTDQDVLSALELPKDNPDPSARKWADEFLESRRDSLQRLAEEEGRPSIDASPSSF